MIPRILIALVGLAVVSMATAQDPGTKSSKRPSPFATAVSNQPLGKLSVQDVIGLADAGVSRDVIMRQIELTNSNFELSARDLVHLKQAEVDDVIVLAMQAKCGLATGAPVQPASYAYQPSRTPAPVVPLTEAPKPAPNWSMDQHILSDSWQRVWETSFPGLRPLGVVETAPMPREATSRLTPERIHGDIIK